VRKEDKQKGAGKPAPVHKKTDVFYGYGIATMNQ
jgi:hypothetical protein